MLFSSIVSCFQKREKVLKFANFISRFVGKGQHKSNQYLIILISSLKLKTKGGFLPSIKHSVKTRKYRNPEKAEFTNCYRCDNESRRIEIASICSFKSSNRILVVMPEDPNHRPNTKIPGSICVDSWCIQTQNFFIVGTDLVKTLFFWQIYIPSSDATVIWIEIAVPCFAYAERRVPLRHRHVNPEALGGDCSPSDKCLKGLMAQLFLPLATEGI